MPSLQIDPGVHRASSRRELPMADLQGPSPLQRLVYPLPEDGGLGIHVTLDLSGESRGVAAGARRRSVSNRE